MYDVVILRTQDICSDSRVLKYEKILKQNNINYLIIGWDRLNQGISRENTVYCRYTAGYQKRIKGIWGRVKYNFFILKWLLINFSSYRNIHACDLDTVLPSILMRMFNKKVIFDIFDWFSDEMRTGNIYIDKLINFIEKKAVIISDLIIICEEDRKKQMDVNPKKYLVIRNMPNEVYVKNKFCDKGDDKIIISYVGGLVEHRGIIELLDFIKRNNQFILKIAGFGNEKIVSYVKELSLTCNNIEFYGKVNYDQALNIMSNSNIIYGMYYISNHNHKYAAPNKFYESLMLGVPLLTNKGTMLADMVKKYKTGYIIDEGKKSLDNFFRKVHIKCEKSEINNIYCEFLKDQEKNYNNYINYIR